MFIMLAEDALIVQIKTESYVGQEAEVKGRKGNP